MRENAHFLELHLLNAATKKRHIMFYKWYVSNVNPTKYKKTKTIGIATITAAAKTYRAYHERITHAICFQGVYATTHANIYFNRIPSSVLCVVVVVSFFRTWLVPKQCSVMLLKLFVYYKFGWSCVSFLKVDSKQITRSQNA